MRKIEFEKLKVGDKLYSIIGKGMMTVIILDKDDDEIIVCRDEDGTRFTFYKDGKYFDNDNYPSLYLDPISFGFQERVMEVSDDGIKWYKYKVLAKFDGGVVVEAKSIGNFHFYKYAREIQQEKKKVVTLELTEDQINSLKQQGIL